MSLEYELASEPLHIPLKVVGEGCLGEESCAFRVLAFVIRFFKLGFRVWSDRRGGSGRGGSVAARLSPPRGARLMTAPAVTAKPSAIFPCPA